MRPRLILGLVLGALLLAGCGSAAAPTVGPPSPSAPPTPAAAAPASVAPPSLAPSAAPPSQAPAAASQPQIVHVLEDPLAWTEVKVGSLSGCKDTTCLGDYLVGRSSLRDATTSKTVGFLVTECFVVDAVTGRYHCPASTMALTGRGQVVFTENILLGPHICPTCGFTPEADPSSGGLTVIGGSGELLGATLAESPGSTYAYGDWVITLTK
jgi:hypothetical protein